jgi:hypothetical protein
VLREHAASILLPEVGMCLKTSSRTKTAEDHLSSWVHAALQDSPAKVLFFMNYNKFVCKLLPLLKPDRTHWLSCVVDKSNQAETVVSVLDSLSQPLNPNGGPNPEVREFATQIMR